MKYFSYYCILASVVNGSQIRECDVFIVGSGPAGLAVASGLAKSSLSVVVADSGRSLGKRDRSAASEATQGVGGAGLFSDGKFSFYPSATQLWKLPGQRRLKKAYHEVQDMLAPCGMAVPPYPATTGVFISKTGHWALKEYPSYYMSLNNRYKLVQSLAAPLADSLLSTTVKKCVYVPAQGKFRIQLSKGGRVTTVQAKYLVLAGGRFSPATFPLKSDMVFERLEIGVRIEQPSKDSLLGDLQQLDPKLKLKSTDLSFEWRTFCACREGETLKTETQGLWTVSGRADCPPTGRSNVGFNIRIQDPKLAFQGWEYVRQTFAQPRSYFNVPLCEGLTIDSGAHAHLKRVYGPLLDNLLVGLRLLAGNFPSILSANTRLIGPCLEGVYSYPKLEENLQISGVPAWVVGDSTGKFRGIVAALVSGRYVAGQILQISRNSSEKA